MKNQNLIYRALTLITISVLLLGGCGKQMNKDDNKVLLPVKDDQTVSFRIWFKVGSQNDPAGKEGLANITAMMMTEGATQTNTFEEVMDKLYPIAADYYNKVDKEMSVFSGRTHIDNLEDYYILLKDALLKPAFKEEDLKRIKSHLVNLIENDLRYASDEELGKAAIYEFIFKGTPYSHLSMGTLEGLNSITLDDIKAFYKKYYTKDNYVIGLGGNYPADFPSRIDKDLSQLPESKAEKNISKPVPEPINGLEVMIIDKKCDATAISMGFPIDIIRSDEDFIPLFLFNSWFGEHRNQSSHLYQVIREKRGMNYGDYSYIETFLDGSSLSMPEPNNPRKQQIFEIWIRPVLNQNRHFAIKIALRELQKAIENGITKSDFDQTKNFLYNYCQYYAQTTMSRLGYQIDNKFYNIPDGGNYIEYFRNKIKNVTLEQVNAAIKKHLQFKNIKIAVVTQDAEGLKNDLINNSAGTIQYITPPPQSILDEDMEIEKYKLPFSAEKIKILTIDEMFKTKR